MGQKVNPIGMRVGIIREWDAKWYAEKEYAEFLHEDLRIRKFIATKLADAAVSTVEIERAANRVNISIHTAKPGMVIGKGGSEVESLRKELNKLIDEDTNSFNEFMKAIKMPKETFKQITERQKALADATLYSIKVPYKTAQLSLEAMKQLDFLVTNGNQNAITDIGVGILMLCTGLEGAILNVKVNLKGLEQKDLSRKYYESCEEMLQEGKEIRDKLLFIIHESVE